MFEDFGTQLRAVGARHVGEVAGQVRLEVARSGGPVAISPARPVGRSRAAGGG